MAAPHPPWFGAFEHAVTETAASEGGRLESLFSIARLWSAPTQFLVKTGYAESFPEPAIECSTEAFETLALAIHGYYQSAVSVLPRQVELALASCLFRHCPNHKTKHCPEHRHRYGKSERTPAWRQLAEVFDLHQFADYALAMPERGRTDLARDVDAPSMHEFYQSISRAVHGVPGTWNVLDWEFQPFPRYSAEAFDAWADLFESVQRVALLWLLLAHTGMFPWIDSHSQQDWAWALDHAEIDYLQRHT